MKLIGAGPAPHRDPDAARGPGDPRPRPCYHMQNVFADLSETSRWRDALDGKLDPAEILAGFRRWSTGPAPTSTASWPRPTRTRRCCSAVRDGAAWAESMRRTIWGLFYDDTLIRHVSDARTKVDPVWAMYIDMMKEMWHRTRLLEEEGTTPEFMASAMERYNDEVRRAIPAERLLSGRRRTAGSRSAGSWRRRSPTCRCRLSTTPRRSSTRSRTSRLRCCATRSWVANEPGCD